MCFYKKNLICLFFISSLYSIHSIEPFFLEKQGKEIIALWTDTAPIIDGKLDSLIWSKSNLNSDFIQDDPHNMESPSEKTIIRFMYDKNYLYVFASMLDSNPDGIVSRLSNRDDWYNGFEGVSDWISIDIDSRHDHQTAFVFAVNSAGVQMDAVVFEDSDYDPEWNAIWESEVSIDNMGWYLEMKIPFSTLRFTSKKNMVWGLNITRYIKRLNEYASWVSYPYGIRGISSKYGHLNGIKDISVKRGIEFKPHFVLGKTNFSDVLLPDPDFDSNFHKHDVYSEEYNNIGLDIKFGINTHSTLDITINPDFGQIEADPAEINLTYFETRFSEKRPFFMENSTTFDTPIEIFYSRRIGNNNAIIKSAEKVTGKFINGIAYGLIHAITCNDTVGNWFEKFMKGNNNQYTIGRVTKDILDGNSYYGLMLGNYSDKDSSNNIVSFDGVFNLLNNRIETDGQIVISNNKKNIGYGKFYEFKYVHPDYFHFWFEYDYYDKEFDINQLGYLNRNNFISYRLGYGLRLQYPWKIFNKISYNIDYSYQTNLDDLILEKKIKTGVDALLYNYWNIGLGVSNNLERYSDLLTYDYELNKLGPIIKLPETKGYYSYISSDSRKSFRMKIGYGYGENTFGDNGNNYSVNIDYMISNYFNLNVSYWEASSIEKYHWLEIIEQSTGSDNSENNEFHYIFSNSENFVKTVTLRMNGNITRKLNIQLYSEFYIYNNKFSNYSELLNGADYPSDTTPFIEDIPYVTVSSGNSEELINPNLTPKLYSKYTELNTNVIVKWEFLPGSNLSFVYSLNKFINGKIFNNIIEFESYKNPEEWEEIYYDKSIFIKLDYWFSI